MALKENSPILGQDIWSKMTSRQSLDSSTGTWDRFESVSSEDPVTVRPLACVQALFRLHSALPHCPHTTFLSPDVLPHLLSRLLIHSWYSRKRLWHWTELGFILDSST